METVMYLYYYEDENIITDDDGKVIYDIFNIITPQNLFLFKHDNGFNLFRHRRKPNVLCEIISVPDEVCGTQYFPEIDVGDDYERIDRYEKAKSSGFYILR